MIYVVHGLWHLNTWSSVGWLCLGRTGMWPSWRMHVTGARFEILKNNIISSSLMLFSSCDCVLFVLPGLSAGILPHCESNGLLLLWNHKPKGVLPSDALVMRLYHSNREVTHTAVLVSDRNSTDERHRRTSPFFPLESSLA